MPVFGRLRSRHTSQLARHTAEVSGQEKSAVVNDYTTGDSDSNSLEARNEKEVLANPNQITVEAEEGVQKAEAVTLVWSKRALYLTYAWIWVCFFSLAMHSAITLNILPYAYSKFNTAPAITTAYILQTIIAGVLRLPIAKILNIWGRAEGLIVFTWVYVLGIIILAASNGPNAVAAGYVLYWIGYDAIYLILDVFIADTSGLRHRAWAFAFAGTPFICTSFTGPLAAQSYVDTSGWRWAFGSFAIIQPFVFLPLAFVFRQYQRKAIRLGLFQRQASNRTAMQSIVHYFHEFDVVGALLLMAAFVLFLLPFSLQTYGRAAYNSATFIVMVVIGVLLFPVFAIWEARFARTQFIKWELFRQRTVLGACCMAAVAFFSFYAWDTYFNYFLRVVYNLSIKDAGYMVEIYNVGTTFWGVIFGIWIYYTKHFKYACLFFGLPLLILGSGLMVHFRGSDTNGHIGYIILCQIFIAFGGGTIVIGEDMAVMAASDRGGIPMMLALLNLAAALGGAIGSAVTSAIFAATFPGAIASRLPPSQQSLGPEIYAGGYLTALEYPVGSVVRNAADYAWSASQKNLAITSTCILILGIPSIAVWKNYNVDKMQNKGTVI